MPYCSQCGERLAPNANFCPNCGVSLAQVPPIENMQATQRKKKIEGVYEEGEVTQEKPSESAPYPEYVTPQPTSQSQEPPPVPKPLKVRTSKSTVNRLAAVIFFAIGIIGLSASVFILLAALSIIMGVPLNFTDILPIIGQYLHGDVTTIVLMILLMIFSALHLLTGNWLYLSLRRGGIAGLVITAIGIVTPIVAIIQLPPTATLDYFIIVVYALLMIIIMVGWNSLHSELELIE